MEVKQNRKTIAPYYVGLDIGTDSVGFAATDTEYKLLRHGGNAIWGVRLFDEGQTAVERRGHRVARRRLARRKWRLHLLRELFDSAIAEKDMGFFARMDESFLQEEDKSGRTKYALFADKDFTDKDYHRLYPTVYHLRKELIENPEPHDVRLVYLALHHLIKSRGHFLEEIEGDERREFSDLWKELKDILWDCLQLEVSVTDVEELKAVLQNGKLGKKDRGTKLKKELLTFTEDEGDEREPKVLAKVKDKICAFLAGSKVKLSELFGISELEGSVELSMGEEEREKACADAQDFADFLRSAFAIYDALRLAEILSKYTYICEKKCDEYEKHRADVKMLKKYVREVLADDALYKRIFVQKILTGSKKDSPLPNYAAYSGYRNRGGDKEFFCKAEEFYTFLQKELGTEPKDPAYAEMFADIADGKFAPKLRTSANGIFPNGLYALELDAILKNAENYLPFLAERDENGLSVSDKIRTILSFRIPYYVGPLKDEKEHPHAWMKRREGEEKSAIYPWNFEKVVNTEDSAEGFITRMTAHCTYTGDAVLPRDSLLYSAYAVLNEINCITVGGKSISVAEKQAIYEELFEKSDRPVTKKKIKDFLVKRFGAKTEDEIGGVDDRIKSSLASYHKLRRYLPALGTELAEEVIRRIVLFGDDKKLLTRWLKENTPLSPEDVKEVSKLRFREWGRLSRAFLMEIDALASPETGEAKPLIHLLWETNETMMQVLCNRGLREAANAYRTEKHHAPESLRKTVEDLYVSPKIRRSIWQTLRILDEIVDVRRAAPKRIFIEMARDQNDNGKKGQRTVSRKDQLVELYKKCKMESDELYSMLQAEDPDRLRADKYYLYYAQFGRCMYSGEPIDIARLADNGVYDIDHIYPRSKIKDDSLANRVLVRAELNREKTDIYPIDEATRTRMYGYWKSLLEKGAISKKKFDRLVRYAPLTPEELADFVNRQLVETRQSSKAVAELLATFLPETEVVYSKAGHVSDFRHEFGFRKCRAVNDHHHAKDAYLNIVVGNFLRVRFTGEFWRAPRTYTVNPERMYLHDVPGAWVAEQKAEDGTVTVPGTIATVRRMMAKNNVLYTRQPRTVTGELYHATHSSAVEAAESMKQGTRIVPLKTALNGKVLPAEKYGGYNSLKIAYFALIEYKEKGKILRSLEGIVICDLQEYEKNPTAYAQKMWGADAHVIVPRILTDSLLEIDGLRRHLNSKTGDQLWVQHAYQFALDERKTEILSAIEKYVAKCDEAKKSNYLTGVEKEIQEQRYEELFAKWADVRKISAEDTVQTYEWLLDALQTRIYGRFFGEKAVALKEKIADFRAASIYRQCKIIMEILHFFTCKAQMPSANIIGITSTRSRISKKVSNCTTAYLIHQSVTGLFEYKTDLLHCEPMPLKK